MQWINNLTTGISVALNNMFGEEYHIYSEVVEQKAEVPWFFIVLKDSSENRIVANRFQSVNVFEIIYAPKVSGDFAEMQSVGNTLSNVLEIIEVDSMKYRGTDMSFKIEEGVLIFKLNYDFHIFKVTPCENMEILESEVNLK